jgi:hypothetical protein
MWLVESLVADNAGGGGVLVVGGGIAVADSTVRGHDGIGVNGNVGLIAGSAIVDNTFGVVTSSESPDVVNSTMTASGTAMTATGRLKVRSSTLVTTGPYPTLRVVGGVQPSVVASIVAGDHNTDHCDVPIGGTSGEWNIFTDDSCVLPGGENLSSTDPLLGPLADNGGPTPTYRPLPGSPAIDAIPFYWWQVCDEDLAVDQRGLPRPVGGACDIGAVELQPGE